MTVDRIMLDLLEFDLPYAMQEKKKIPRPPFPSEANALHGVDWKALLCSRKEYKYDKFCIFFF